MTREISTLLIVIVLIIGIWAMAGGRPFFRSTGQDLKATVQDAGQDVKSMGRDAADSIRRTVQ